MGMVFDGVFVVNLFSGSAGQHRSLLLPAGSAEPVDEPGASRRSKHLEFAANRCLSPIKCLNCESGALYCYGPLRLLAIARPWLRGLSRDRPDQRTSPSPSLIFRTPVCHGPLPVAGGHWTGTRL